MELLNITTNTNFIDRSNTSAIFLTNSPGRSYSPAISQSSCPRSTVSSLRPSVFGTAASAVIKRRSPKTLDMPAQQSIEMKDEKRNGFVKEETPSRELGSKLGGLSLGADRVEIGLKNRRGQFLTLFLAVFKRSFIK